MNIIIFSEPRSGSTVLCMHIEKTLNLSVTYDSRNKMLGNSLRNQIDNGIFRPSDNHIFFTHDFELIKYLDRFIDPILIYTSRKNKTEQCLSHLILNYVNSGLSKEHKVSNMSTERDSSIAQKIYTETQPKIFLKSEIVHWCNNNKESNKLWHEYSQGYKNQTIYYEEMFEPIDMPHLNLYNCPIFSSTTLQKLPEYKSTICLNKNLVEKWIKEFY